MTDLMELVKAFGLQAVITMAVLWGGWKLIGMFSSMANRTIEMLEKANSRWQEVVDGMTKTLNQHRQEVKEAHQFQRNEHQKFAEQQAIQTEQMREVCDGLGRINGYKHD